MAYTRQPDPEKVKREEGEAMPIKNTGPAPYRREPAEDQVFTHKSGPGMPVSAETAEAIVAAAEADRLGRAAGVAGVSIPAVTPHDPGRPVLSAPAIPGVSPVVAKALAKDRRDAPEVKVWPDPNGAPRAEGPVVGDTLVLAECLKWLARITDPGSLAAIKANVDGRVGVPEAIAPKQSGHTV